MGPLRELLSVDERRTLEFFVTGLKDVCDERVDVDELLYNASVLAHYALVSTDGTTDCPAPTSLATVFDQFVREPDCRATASLMEEAGAQCLLMSGFFEDQMRGRHNIRWYRGWARRSSARGRRSPRRCAGRSSSARWPGTSRRGGAATRGWAASCGTRRSADVPNPPTLM